MSVDLTKVFTKTCEVLIKARTDAVTETSHAVSTDWIHVGTIKAGSGKFTESENTYEPHVGKTKISSLLGIEASGIEVDDTAVDALEAVEGSPCDILLQPVSAVDAVESARLKLLAVRPRLLLEGGFDGKDILSLKLVADGTFSSITDFIKNTTADWILSPGASTLSWIYNSHVYFAKRSNANTAVDHSVNTGWVDLGAYKAGSGKVTQSEQTIDTTRGKILVSKTLGFNVTGLETDDAKLAAIVAKEGAVGDVLLVPANSSSTARLKFLAVIPRVGFEGGFDGKEVPGTALKFEGVYSLLSEFVMKTTANWRL